MVAESSILKINNFFSHFTTLHFKKREIIVHPDEELNHIFLIKSGYVRAYRISEEGEELTLTIFKPGDFFPLSYAVDNIPNPYFIEAVVAIEAQRAPKDEFLKFIRENSDVFYELTNWVLEGFDGLLSRMEYLLTSRAPSKVAATISVCGRRFGSEQNGNIVVGLPLTHKDIAAMVGLTRETTCLEMKKLEKQGLISYHGRLLIIKDIAKLENGSQFSF